MCTWEYLGVPQSTSEYLAETSSCLHSSGDLARVGRSPQYPVTGCNRHLQLGPHLGPFTRVALPSLHRGRDWPSVQCSPRPLPSMDVGQPKKVLEVVHCGAWCHPWHVVWNPPETQPQPLLLTIWNFFDNQENLPVTMLLRDLVFK